MPLFKIKRKKNSQIEGGALVYGHQFYRFPVDRRVQFINTQLQQGGFDSLEELADYMFLDVDDIKRELNQHGYIFVPGINQFVHCVGTASTWY
jgi:predicted AlkP superfamily pyrophosphatase or phosphodiesterase